MKVLRVEDGENCKILTNFYEEITIRLPNGLEHQLKVRMTLQLLISTWMVLLDDSRLHYISKLGSSFRDAFLFVDFETWQEKLSVFVVGWCIASTCHSKKDSSS